MTTDRRPINLPNIVVGIATMALGGVLILSTLGLVDVRELFRFWPVLLILLGATIVAQSVWVRSTGEQTQGAGYGWLVALIVVIAIVGAVDGRRGPASADGGDSLSVHSVMGRQMRVSGPVPFRGGAMTSVMGSSALDLRNAVVAPGEEVEIDVFAVMGGIDLIVPPQWVVDVRAVTVMGGVEDSRNRTSRRRRRGDDEPLRPEPPIAPSAASEPPNAEPPATAAIQNGPPPRVIVRGFVMMGGVDINP
jgi:hypothetical protein